MSAYVVDNKTMDRIVNYIHYHSDNEWILRQFKEVGVEESPRELGQALFNLNCAAVDVRYNERTKRPHYEFHYNSAAQVVVYKALSSLIYQCSEGDVMSHKLYDVLLTTKAWIADNIISEMKEYENAPW